MVIDISYSPLNIQSESLFVYYIIILRISLDISISLGVKNKSMDKIIKKIILALNGDQGNEWKYVIPLCSLNLTLFIRIFFFQMFFLIF